MISGSNKLKLGGGYAVAELASLSRSTVIRTLNELEEKGYIKKEHRFKHDPETEAPRQTTIQNFKKGVHETMNFGDSFRNFIYWEAASRDTIDFKKIYVDMTDDILAGLLLSQIVFWHLPNKTGDSKLRVQKEGHYWIAKSHDEWYEEIRFTRKNFDTAIKKLIQLNLVEKKIFKFNGAPRIHVRLLEENFLNTWNNTLEMISKKEEEEKTPESLSDSDLSHSGKSEKTAPIMDLSEWGNSICPNGANGNDRIGQIFNRDYYRDNKQNRLIDCRENAREEFSLSSESNEITTEPNHEIWKALQEYGSEAMIQDTVSLAETEYLPEIHNMLEKHFSMQLDPDVVRIACQIFSDRSYDWTNFKMKIMIENPVGFFRSCYLDAIKRWKLTRKKNYEFVVK